MRHKNDKESKQNVILGVITGICLILGAWTRAVWRLLFGFFVSWGGQIPPSIWMWRTKIRRNNMSAVELCVQIETHSFSFSLKPLFSICFAKQNCGPLFSSFTPLATSLSRWFCYLPPQSQVRLFETIASHRLLHRTIKVAWDLGWLRANSTPHWKWQRWKPWRDVWAALLDSREFIITWNSNGNQFHPALRILLFRHLADSWGLQFGCLQKGVRNLKIQFRVWENINNIENIHILHIFHHTCYIFLYTH